MSHVKAIGLALSVTVFAVAQTTEAQWDDETPMTSTGSDVWGEGIAATGDTLHLVFGSGEIRYRRSTDQGSSWSDAVPIGNGTLHLTDPIVADGDDVWVIYLDNLQNVSDWCCVRDMGEIWMLHSGDAGDSWDDPIQLTTVNTAFRLSIAYAADRLHLVWMDFRDNAWDTYYLRSPDRGESWDDEVPIAESAGPFGAERPQIAARNDSVHVTIWDDRDATNAACTPGTFTFPACPDVFHMRSTDGGESWSSIVNVVNGGAFFAGRNDIAVSGDSSVVINYNIDVDGETGSKLFTVSSDDDGETWNDPVRLTTSPNASDHGSIIGTQDASYLVWHDDRDSSNREIYYVSSLNGGASWEDEEQVSTGAAGDSTTPLNAVTTDYTHVIWIDNRGGSYQVYYRRRALPSIEMPDAGTALDGAIDDADGGAGPSASDASVVMTNDGSVSGLPDASVVRDAALADGDAIAAEPDAAGTGAGASSAQAGDAGGCGCRVTRRDSSASSIAWLTAATLVWRLRRRRAGLWASQSLQPGQSRGSFGAEREW